MVPTCVHPGGAVEATLELRADVAEGAQTQPARLDGAAAAHAVTLALLPHVPTHLL